MDKSTIIWRETRFRLPGPGERGLGLWIDRTGAGEGGVSPTLPRVLGQYAAIAVERGSGWFESADCGKLAVAEGDAIVLTPKVVTAYWPEPRWHTQWIVWNGADAERLEQLGQVPPAGVLRHAGQAVVRARAAVLPLMDDESPAAPLARRVAVESLLLELGRAQHTNQASRALHDLGERATRYLRQHLTEAIAMPELARVFSLSESHFRRRFKAATGLSPLAYVTRLRLERAQELLAAGVSIKATAEAVGYADPFYFMRQFRLHTGQTAGAFAAQRHGV